MYNTSMYLSLPSLRFIKITDIYYISSIYGIKEDAFDSTDIEIEKEDKAFNVVYKVDNKFSTLRLIYNDYDSAETDKQALEEYLLEMSE